MTDFGQLLGVFSRHQVRFIIIGGFAATAHGSAFLTVDLDVVYDRTAENVARLVEALAPLSPYLRGAPPGLPFCLDADTVASGLNFTLTTTAGDLDLLGEAAGGGTYDGLSSHTETRQVLGVECRFVDLDTLIAEVGHCTDANQSRSKSDRSNRFCSTLQSAAILPASWPYLPARDSASTRSPRRSASVVWARSIAPPTRS